MTEVPLEPGQRILVVDDDLNTRSLLSELCESCGYTVFGAADGNSAIEIATQSSPDLMLLDLILPGKDGFEVLKEMRERQSLKEIPVIVVSAIHEIDGKIRAMELGADDFLSKPIKLFELQARIQSALLIRTYRRRLASAELELSQYRALDPLTGAGTYAHLKATLDSELGRVRRYGRPAAILLFSFDFGEWRAREKTDDFIRSAIDAIRAILRASDRLFRLDTDHFVALLPETAAAGAVTTGVRLRELVSRLGPKSTKIGLKLGKAMFPTDAVETTEDLLRQVTRDYRQTDRAT